MVATPKKDITLQRFLTERWMPAVRATVRESTYIGFDIHIRNHIVPFIGRMPLKKITGERLNDLYAQLAVGGSARGGPLAPATVRRVHVTLHRIFKDAVRWGYLRRNPCEAADPPRLRASGHHEMRTWTAVQLATFLAGSKDDPLYPVYHLIAMTGMRRGEALGLRWQDVDLDRAELAVRQTLLELRTGLRFSTPKTARGARVIALDERTVSILAEHRNNTTPEGLVFARPDGSPIRPLLVTKHFKVLTDRLGLPRIRLHDLRHTHATLALQADVHPKIVSERLGHASIALTLDLYSHAIPHMQAEAAAQIAALVEIEDEPS